MNYSLIITILNRGFSDLVMDSARENGARGGTIITARGTGSKVAEKLFGIVLSEEKEMILILTPTETKNQIMSAICKTAGLNTQGKGITFSLPVENVLGIANGINDLTFDNSKKDETAAAQTDLQESKENDSSEKNDKK